MHDNPAKKTFSLPEVQLLVIGKYYDDDEEDQEKDILGNEGKSPSKAN